VKIPQKKIHPSTIDSRSLRRAPIAGSKAKRSGNRIKPSPTKPHYRRRRSSPPWAAELPWLLLVISLTTSTTDEAGQTAAAKEPSAQKTYPSSQSQLSKQQILGS